MLAEESTPLPWGPPVIQVTSLTFGCDWLMIINLQSLYRGRSRNRNQRFLHSRDTHTCNCRLDWSSLDRSNARSLLTKLSRNRLSPMFQLSIWKHYLANVRNVEVGVISNFREALYETVLEPSKLPGANERSAGVGLAFVELFHRRPNGSGGGLQIASSQQPAVNIQQTDD